MGTPAWRAVLWVSGSLTRTGHGAGRGVVAGLVPVPTRLHHWASPLARCLVVLWSDKIVHWTLGVQGRGVTVTRPCWSGLTFRGQEGMGVRCPEVAQSVGGPLLGSLGAAELGQALGADEGLPCGWRSGFWLVSGWGRRSLERICGDSGSSECELVDSPGHIHRAVRGSGGASGPQDTWHHDRAALQEVTVGGSGWGSEATTRIELEVVDETAWETMGWRSGPSDISEFGR